jgi:surface protein
MLIFEIFFENNLFDLCLDPRCSLRMESGSASRDFLVHSSHKLRASETEKIFLPSLSIHPLQRQRPAPVRKIMALKNTIITLPAIANSSNNEENANKSETEVTPIDSSLDEENVIKSETEVAGVSNKQRNIWAGAILLLAVAVAVGVGLGVGLSGYNNRTSTNSIPIKDGGPATSTPTPSPNGRPDTTSSTPNTTQTHTPSPTGHSDTGGFQCFETTQELYFIVDQYLADSRVGTVVAQVYGWPIRTWCVSNIQDFSELFFCSTSQCTRSITRSFNEDIGEWDMRRATNLTSMFRRADSFDQDISLWNTSSVTTMESMFQLFQQCLPLGYLGCHKHARHVQLGIELSR